MENERNGKEPELLPVPISALQHYSYCPRQCALIHIEQAFDENVHTLRGRAVHETVDDPARETVAPGIRTETALPLFSDRLGLIGKADMVEFRGDAPYPIEYKHGTRRDKAHDDLQLAAQTMCLEEMTGIPVPEGALYYYRSRRRRTVPITPELRQQVEESTEAVRRLLRSGLLPPPVNDSRCKECSLKDICQPEAVAEQNSSRLLLQSLFSVEDEDDPSA